MAERIGPEHAEIFRRMHEWNVEHYGAGRGVGVVAGRRRAPQVAIEPIELVVGDRVKFYGDRRWWDVRAVDREYVVLTRTGDFGGTVPRYTVIAWAEGRRGPHGSWGHAAETDAEIAATLAALVSGQVEMSERRSIRLDIESIRPGVSRG